MITIRQEQVARLNEYAEEAFREEMRTHLKGFHPPHARAAGDEGLNRLIDTGLKRVRSYGYRLRGSLRFFLEQLLLFGHEFDTDPMIPWGNEFARRGMGDELIRADDIHARSSSYYNSVVGPEGEIEQAAIRKFLAMPVSAWLASDASDAGICETFEAVYPTKCAAAGGEAVRQLVVAKRRAATAVGLPSRSGGFVLAALAFGLGHSCVTDPQYPWIAAQLKETKGEPGEERVEKLAKRGMAFLSYVLAEHEGA